MVQFRFTIPVRIKGAVVDDPELIGDRVKIHVVNHLDPLCDAIFISRILSPNALNFSGMDIFQYDIIKDQRSDRPD